MVDVAVAIVISTMHGNLKKFQNLLTHHNNEIAEASKYEIPKLS